MDFSAIERVMKKIEKTNPKSFFEKDFEILRVGKIFFVLLLIFFWNRMLLL